MTTAVISQPMIFPWGGLVEQVRLSDVFIHYDDVQLPQGRSFITRVQVKTQSGIQWLTVPVVRDGRMLIKDVRTDESQKWRETHLKTLRHAYSKAPFFEEMFALATDVYGHETPFLADFAIRGIEAVAAYFGLSPRFLRSSTLGTGSHSTEKLVEVCRLVGATVYVTGHGARNYLDHALFDRAGIEVRYMDYLKRPRPQLHGDFTPFVTALDLVAHCGRAGIQYLDSPAIHWREFLAREEALQTISRPVCAHPMTEPADPIPDSPVEVR